MQKFSDNKRRTVSTAFNLVVFVFLVATLSLLVWQLPNGASSTVQTQTKGQVAPISTVVIIGTPTVEVETGQVVSKTGIVVHERPAASVLGVVIDEKQTVILVEPGSAAEKAGVQLGDILERVEDIPLILEEDRIKAKLAMGGNLDGTVVRLTVFRAGETLEIPFIPELPLRVQLDAAQAPEQDAKQEPTPTITPVWPPFYYF